MSTEAVKTLVQAFISCHLDYCNSLIYGIAEGLMSRLQSVQNAAERLVSGARRYDRITPVLRVDFKMATLVYLAWLQPIWPPTVSWSLTKVVVSCVLPRQGRVLSDEPTATKKTGVLQLHVRSCGTAFQLNCDKLTLAFNDLSRY